MMRKLFLLALLSTGAVQASVSVTDDAGHVVTLQAPARRIVSLAPNITDALFAAGAGDHIVGTSRFSDHPDAAKAIPVIGDATSLDLERIVSLKPDLIMAWKSGTPAVQVEKLTRLGITVFYVETTRLADIAPTVRRLGILTGTTAVANEHAAAFDTALANLRTSYAGRRSLKVFFQVWDKPLMTVGKAQIIDDAIDLCGGTNIFADLGQAAPAVTREAVVSRAPDVIITAGADASGLAGWQTSTFIPAVKHRNVFVIDAPTLVLPSPSILSAVETLCRRLDEARQRDVR